MEHDNLLFFTCGLSAIIQSISEKIKDYPHLLAVILNYEYGTSNTGTEVVEMDNGLFCSYISKDGIRKNTLTVKNSSFNLDLTENTAEKLIQAVKYSTS